MKTIRTFSLEIETVEKLEELARITGKKKSHIISELIEFNYRKVKKGEK